MLGVPPGSITEEELLNMTFEVSHYFEKEVGNYYEYINREAIGKDRVVKVAEMRAVLMGEEGDDGAEEKPPIELVEPLIRHFEFGLLMIDCEL